MMVVKLDLVSYYVNMVPVCNEERENAGMDIYGRLRIELLVCHVQVKCSKCIGHSVASICAELG